MDITSASSIELNADVSSGSITFTANRDWSISTSDAWVSVSPSSGKASDSPVTVTVRCNANTTYDERTATVTIRMEDLSQTVSIVQPANLGIILPKQLFDLQSDAKSIEIEVQANVQYTVSTSANWIKQTGTKGLTSKTLTLSIDENKTYDPREGTITIKPQDSSVKEQVVSVKQAQKDALNVEKTSYEMPYGGGEIEIKVESNVVFDVTSLADWIHYTQTKALSSSTVCLRIDENKTFSSRQGAVEITQQNGSLKHTITINQAGRIAVTSVELDQTVLSLKPGETATLTATVKPDDATDKTVTWSSSDIAVATVDDTGKVTAVKEGTAIITAKAGDKIAECQTTVFLPIPVTSIELDNYELTLEPGETATLTATVSPDNATNKTVTWTSSDSEIVIVDENGNVTAVSKGKATIIASSNDCSEFFSSCSIIVYRIDTPDIVDLGLSVKWASFNIGASAPEEFGEYYAWGETEPKSDYSWATYKWANGEGTKLTKYCQQYKQYWYEYDDPYLWEYWDGTGIPDGKLILEPEDDVANVKLGGKWRIPTSAEWKELCDNSTRSWTTQNGVNGWRVSSLKNSNSIFLPAASYWGEIGFASIFSGSSGHYWSSTLVSLSPDNAGCVSFSDSVFDYDAGRFRYYGFSVRPVTE